MPAYPEPANPFRLGVKLGVDDVESEMTQPAKVQEPSMEEILASIRRIIADDEAKPAEKANAPAVAASSNGTAPSARPPLTRDAPPSTAAAKAAPPTAAAKAQAG